MAKGINIGIAADTRDFDQGVRRGIVQPLEDAADQLQTLARQSDRSTDSIEDDFRDQQKSTEDLRRDYQKLNREIEDGSKKSSRAVSDNTRAGSREASEGLDELSDSAHSNATETAASFDGTGQSIVDGFQGVASEALAGFGPAGIAAGLALAAGIGLASTAFQNGQLNAEQLEQKVNDLTTDFITYGSKGTASLDAVNTSLQTLAEGGDDAGVTLKTLFQTADKAGFSAKDLARAYAGQSTNLDALIKRTQTRVDLLQEENDSLQANSGLAYRDQVGGEDPRIAQGKKYLSYLQDAKKATKEAAAEQKRYIEAGGPELEAASAAAQSYAESIQGAATDAGESWEDYTTKGVTDFDKYNDALEANFKAATDYQANVKTLSKTLSTDALNYIESLGIDAAPLVQQFIDQPLAEQKRTAANWDKIGKTSATSYNASLQANLPKSVDGPAVKLTVDDSAIVNYLAFKKRSPDSVPVSLIPTTVGSGVRVP